ncbi:uncharacterized protein LOC115081704 isoform X2 [Rhinatrema bivittatum]|uniref:uncharacterized protein LOC115081704 isoform X2 n=1 Tax=Rhinatrema bivittatum TaxID=194408 RepID=UPI0011291CD5|nr:uncharacterized protein LOC115081704 isoform X2 [Rhinatrema bivittatum]
MGFGSTPESVTGAQSKSSCFEKPSLRFSDSQPKPRRSGIGEDRAATQGQYCPGKGFPDFRLSRVDILHEWDRRAAMLNTSSDSSRLNIKRPKEIILKRGAPSPAGPPDPHTSSTAAGLTGTGVSEDLEAADNPLELTSLYKAEEQCLTGISPESSPPLPLLNTELKASNPLSVFEYETDHQQEDLSKAIQPSAEPSGGRPFMVLPNLTRLKPKAVIPATLMASSDALHRGHALFQEVENELDGLWSNVERCRQRSCSDVVHPTAQREKEKGPCKARTQDYGQPIVTSASDLRDAEFTPSTSARNREGERRTSLSVDLRERRRQEEPRETSHQITFSDLPGAPCTAEEEEETNIVGNPRGAEFLLMEGTLGKKHTLQQGGKKAAGRSWSRYHAVLVRRTLCFYQDRKDSMKSPVLVTSLTLRGAVCSLELDYTKKPHVFRLHLADGWECLLQAPSAALTQEWVSKIQQNAAVSEGDLFQSFVPVPSGRSCLAAGAGGHQSVPEDSREIFRLPPPAAPLHASQGSLEDPGQLKVCYLLTSL